MTPESLHPCSDGACVKVAFGDYGDGAEVAVHDSKEPDGSVLYFTAHEWQAFLAGVHAGEFDLPDEQTDPDEWIDQEDARPDPDFDDVPQDVRERYEHGECPECGVLLREPGQCWCCWWKRSPLDTLP